ncbi:MAG TPA: hypothetical protein VGB14_15525 [Acidimicrobiales bacterium]|jgi:hypothetical protein
MTRRTLLFLVGAVPVVALAALVLAGGPASSDRLVERFDAHVGEAAPADVTLADYRAAADRAVDCVGTRLRAEARRRFPDGSVTVVVGQPRLSADGYAITYDYGFRFAGGADPSALPPSLADVPGRIDAGCQAEHLSATEAAYQRGRLADGDYVRKVDAGFRACLADGGVAVAPDADAHEALADLVEGGDGLPPAAVGCVERFPAVTGVPGA